METAGRDGHDDPPKPAAFESRYEVDEVVDREKLTGGTLCEFCQNVDLEPNSRQRNSEQFFLGDVQHIYKTQSCPFCRLMLAAWPGGFLKGYPPPSVKWMEDGHGYYPGGSASKRIVFLNEESATFPLGSGRLMSAEVNPDLIRKWINLCAKHHSPYCDPEQQLLWSPDFPTGLKTLRVIDVEDQCITALPEGSQYLALSYLWGRAPMLRLLKRNKGQFMTPGSMSAPDLRSAIPKTIADSMALVSLIGQRYLWVDALCLVQDDPEDMHDGIAKMHLVYRGAISTILAATGTDANAGLPAVRPGSRKLLQVIEEVKPGVKMTIIDSVFSQLRGPYTDRGWTFQEQVLSSRTIIFTEHHVFFRCNRNIWGEDIIYDNFPLVENKAALSGLNEIPNVSFGDGDEAMGVLERYMRLLMYYSVRKLTKGRDSVNALAGVLSHLCLRLGCDHLEGLPTRFFDLSLLFWHITPSKRRRGFPSWSWSGWSAGIVWGYLPENDQTIEDWLKISPYNTWAQRSRDMPSPQPVYEAKFRSLLPDSPDSSQLTLDIPPSNLNRRYPTLQFWSKTVTFPRLQTGRSGANTYDIMDKSGVVRGSVALDTSRMPPHPYEFLLLSEADSCANFWPLKEPQHAGKPFIWAMLIARSGPVSYRRGLGVVHCDFDAGAVIETSRKETLLQ